ncbi:NrfD/PsrC family molybdoenzyme membrane anchor subunit [Orrella sp. 11846]|uniref:NrfD/PsrC family molybdoenzyme membrane anchor subunit n=1 Tax=Orrella sp. 11846 TaxID=3409913 RepID=UPI003B5AE03F
MQIIEILTPSYEVAWLPWAVQYFFLIGIATTTALTASFVGFSGSQSARALMPALIVVLVVSAVAAPVSLLADLHQPARFWHFYAHPTPWSWMSLGAFLLPVFVGLSLLFCFLWWLGKTGLQKLVGVLLILSSISILVYTGMEVMVIKSRPLWNTPFLPINFALTGWLASLGATLLIARWIPGYGVRALPATLIKRLLVASVSLLILCAFVWVVAGMAGFEPSYDAAMFLFAQFPVWRIGLLGSVVTGLIVMLLLVRQNERVICGWQGTLLALIILAAAWMFRWIIFMAVQGVPKYGAGLYLYSMPLGSDGLTGMLGMLGLCIALIAIVTALLAYFPAKSTTGRSPFAHG